MIDRSAARLAAIVVLALLSAAVAIMPAEAGAADDGAILVLVPQDEAAPAGYSTEIADGFARIPELSLGLSSATQGSYRREQALLDISQGTRVSRSTYSPDEVPPVGLIKMVNRSGAVKGWDAILARAATAPQTIEPGLLASSIPGGAAYVGDATRLQETVIPATGRTGLISRLALANTRDVARRTMAQAGRFDLVVVETSPGRIGLRELRQILRQRKPGQLVIATQTPPLPPILPLLPIAAAGPGPAGSGEDGPGGLTSDTTNMPGLVAGIDIGPTILTHLGIAIPEAMKGRAFRVDGSRNAGALTPFRDRLADVGPRRTPALFFFVAAWLLLFLAVGAIRGVGAARPAVARIGGLAVLWLPSVTLIPAALGNPSADLEYAIIAGGPLLLGYVSDRLLPWPRATLLPAAIGLTVITVDLALGSQLITRSVFGPNPGYGSRFYGVGNELKPALTVLMLAGVAAALTGKPKSNRNALILVACGLVLGVVLGSARLGAGVGAVIIVAAATAVAAIMMLPGRFTRRRIALLILSPLIGLALLAALDLLTAGGKGHYTHSVLSLGSPDGFFEIVRRRTTLAWQQLWRGNMPVVTLSCLLAAAFAIRNRERLRPFAGPIWPAALVGGLTGGLIGSVTEDSGPMLIVVATIALAGVCSYLLGRPADIRPGRSDPASGEGRITTQQ